MKSKWLLIDSDYLCQCWVLSGGKYSDLISLSWHHKSGLSLQVEVLLCSCIARSS